MLITFQKNYQMIFLYQLLEKKYHHATFHKKLIIDTHKGQQ